jgi:type II secretory pathway component PulL
MPGTTHAIAKPAAGIPVRSSARRIGILAACLLTSGFLASSAHADQVAAQNCAARLSRDSRTIYEATLPELRPGADLRALVTARTRSLAMSGKIARGSARASATAAGQCLQLDGS